MAAEIREHLLRPPPHRPPRFATTGVSTSVQRPFIPPPDFAAAGRGPLFPVTDFKKRGQSLRSWVRVDAATGASHILDVDKFSMMRRCDLPARDLRLLDPVFVYPSTILGRERAIVVNLEQIRCIITADEILLLVPPNELHLLNSPSESHILNSTEGYVKRYVMELQRRLTVNSGEDGVSPPDNLPFEFLALEVAFEAACTFLDGQAVELESEAYPVLDELAVKISTLNLERARRLKSRLVALTRRVQKVRDEIEQLMDDDGDMAEMYLTEKKRRMEASLFGEQSLLRFAPGSTGISVSAPVSPVSSPPESRKLEKSLSTRSRIGSSGSSYSNTENIEELEMLLEAYFVVSDSILYKLNSLKEYIDDTEDFINIQLDNVRNQLMKFELLLSAATFVVAIFGVVAGIFGMNFDVDIFRVEGAFQWVLVITGFCGLVIFCSFLCFFRYRRLLQL